MPAKRGRQTSDLEVHTTMYFLWCDVLAKRLKVAHEKHPFDQVVAVAKGGLIVGTYVAYKLDLPLYVVYASSYEERQQKKLTTFVPTHIPLRGKKVLLIAVSVKGQNPLVRFISTKATRMGIPTSVRAARPAVLHIGIKRIRKERFKVEKNSIKRIEKR